MTTDNLQKAKSLAETLNLDELVALSKYLKICHKNKLTNTKTSVKSGFSERDRVTFDGKTRGQITGTIIKIMTTNVKVLQDNSNTVWTVSPILLTKITSKEPAKTRRTEKEIMNDFLQLAIDRSPENLHCDGEISRTQANRKKAQINRSWRLLEQEIGRQMSESDVWAWDRVQATKRG